MKNLAIITGADGGMGTHQTLALAKAGFRVIMACYDTEAAEPVRQRIVSESSNEDIEVIGLNLADLSSVHDFAKKVIRRGQRIDILMCNAGCLETHRHTTTDGLEWTVSVNYMGHYLLTRQLLPLMGKGSRVVCMSSCSYLIGRLDMPDFFHRGRKGRWQRFMVYGNTKLALVLFVRHLAEIVKDRGITVNAADPGIVDTGIIRLHNWVDLLTDLIYRPLINTPAQGAATAIHLMLSPDVEGITGGYFKNSHQITLPRRIISHPMTAKLWSESEHIVTPWLNLSEQ